MPKIGEKAPVTKQEKPTPVPAKKENGKKKDPAKPKILYPEFKVKVCLGDKALRMEAAKEMLGWTENEEEAKAAGVNECSFEWDKKKIWLLHNLNNRPVYSSVWERLVQELLRKRWRFNGEPIIIGKHGSILNGQHSLISIVIAELTRLASPQEYEDFWAEPVFMERVVEYGIDEDDDIINTMDTCRPRSSTDVLYRSEFFMAFGRGPRREMARITEYAIKTLWRRTNVPDIYRTHSETVDFLHRHPKLVEVAKHVHDENNTQRLGKVIFPGHAAALLYLMACSDTDGTAYLAQPIEKRSERFLDFGKWGVACDFWSKIASSKTMAGVRQAIKDLAEGGYIAQKFTILIRAWNLFLEKKPITHDAVKLQDRDYHINSDGVKKLLENPAIAGIDCGPTLEGERDLELTPSQIAEVESRKEEVINGVHQEKEEKDTPETYPERLARLHKQYPKTVAFLFTNPLGRKVCWDEDAQRIGLVIGKEPKMHVAGYHCLTFKDDEYERVVDLVVDKTGEAVGVCLDEVAETFTFTKPAKKGR